MSTFKLKELSLVESKSRMKTNRTTKILHSKKENDTGYNSFPLLVIVHIRGMYDVSFLFSQRYT